MENIVAVDDIVGTFDAPASQDSVQGISQSASCALEGWLDGGCV